MNIKTLLGLTIFLCLGLLSQAQNCTNVTLVVGGPPGTNASFNIDTGQIAKVVYVYGNARKFPAILRITAAGNEFALPAYTTNYFEDIKLPVIVAGPASFSLTSQYNAGWGSAFCTIEVTSLNQSSMPSTAVVIPADSGWPVNIILESSADLINWYPSLPGTYGANYTNRFFRVRAQLTQ
jgi:hypothetical protein